ncbi:MAG: CoA pyrophosphatase [Desulfobacterales bacterium]|nr:CoA pyrophosphatase [Desulfobacterales bacterium]
MNTWNSSKNSSPPDTESGFCGMWRAERKAMTTLDARRLEQKLEQAPAMRIPLQDRSFMASVIMLLFEKSGEPYILAVLKTDTHGYPWRNQVALPGGHMEKNDVTPLDTALRELEEELCITPDHLHVTGSMGHFPTIRQTVIECFVALWDGDTNRLKYDPTEISRIIEVPVNTLRYLHESAGFSGRIPDTAELTYPYDNVVIWGVTARMIHFLLEHII